MLQSSAWDAVLECLRYVSSSTDAVPCKTYVNEIAFSLKACALSQAIQALQAATQLWLQKPGRAAQEAITGLGHFPAVIQALVQVMLISICCKPMGPRQQPCDVVQSCWSFAADSGCSPALHNAHSARLRRPA